jgi:hypothetical protein
MGTPVPCILAVEVNAHCLEIALLLIQMRFKTLANEAAPISRGRILAIRGHMYGGHDKR